MRQAYWHVEGDFEAADLAYLDWGDPSAGRTIVAVHGLTRNAHDFDILAASLSQHARLIAIDVVGRGDSSWLSDKSDYDLPIYAAQILALLEGLKLNRVDWIGTSMGGLIGLLIAARADTPIARLVLNDIGPFISSKTLDGIRTYLGLSLEFDSLDDVEQHLRQIHATFGPLTDEQWHSLSEHSARREGPGWRMHYDPDIRVPFLASVAEDTEMWEVYDRIRCPTLLLRGAESLLLDQNTAEAMTQRGPKAKAVTFPGIGHAPALMSEDQIKIITEFLGVQEPASRVRQ